LTEGQIDGETKGLRQGGREGKKRVERREDIKFKNFQVLHQDNNTL